MAQSFRDTLEMSPTRFLVRGHIRELGPQIEVPGIVAGVWDEIVVGRKKSAQRALVGILPPQTGVPGKDRAVYHPLAPSTGNSSQPFTDKHYRGLVRYISGAQRVG